MFESRIKIHPVFAGLLGLLLPLSFAWGGTLKLTIKPTNSGTVSWQTTNTPNDSGVFSGSGGQLTYTMNQTWITLVFHPNTGGSIVKIMTNEGDDTTFVLNNANTDYWHGPGENSKTVTVTFSGSVVAPVDPTGTVPLTFPTNNTQLTAIADVSGTYTGTTPRVYNVTIAQDEAGKMQANGHVQGVQVKGPVRAAATAYTDNLNLNIGAISTVHNQPTINLKSKFEGLIDTNPASINGSGQLAVGSGTNGISGTTSYSGKVGSFTLPPVKNQPTTIATPSTAIHKAWSISLSLANKVNAKTHKAYIGATGVLIRPDGNVIAFPEQVVKYSTKTGYSLILKSGTNTTLHVVDKKTTVTIKGLTMTKVSTTWIPTAGALSYQFMGQKGTGSLMDFLP